MLLDKIRVSVLKVMTALLPLMILLSSCNKETPTGPRSQSAQKTFTSPDDAAKALVEAAQSNSRDALLAILGAGSEDIIYSGDATQDKAAIAGFVSDYGAMHRFRDLSDGSELLITGTDNKSFPLPLKQNSAGQWYFDVEAGKKEILARRIGKDETAAIDICAAIADAQQQYFSQPHDGAKQYAKKFISDEGKQNGLYWPTTEGQPKSPLGPLVAYASAEGYKVQQSQHQPFYGYYFAMLDKQGPDAKGGAKNYIINGKLIGGFAVVAYPAQYRDSGIMTFIINQNGPAFQKDLGPTTDQVAATMTEFNPDKSWTVVE
ncbi:DUF2950 domain-containing protein [Alloacidobacterium sp.]|uniref:DUF2950 domain-containing protein n=1 Tax=Alloacidobacterium sp. TaxID=2951999 RepID=UPI002D3F593A|nr:DUF2950 domain-containing protein [Alloacidobacterium sp.]HYK36590.1 DUF2950 domain-containing protein [Alloacidobacterium sp.]